MKKTTKVMGQSAPSPRLTKAAALLIATGLSVPVFVLLTLLESLLF
ncbi:hypothetical protein [Leisingera sp. ANG-Vp]|nr:hypothetical protein [Leisingera sp. ANG-Vp]